MPQIRAQTTLAWRLNPKQQSLVRIKNEKAGYRLRKLSIARHKLIETQHKSLSLAFMQFKRKLILPPSDKKAFAESNHKQPPLTFFFLLRDPYHSKQLKEKRRKNAKKGKIKERVTLKGIAYLAAAKDKRAQTRSSIWGNERRDSKK